MPSAANTTAGLVAGAVGKGERVGLGEAVTRAGDEGDPVETAPVGLFVVQPAATVSRPATSSPVSELTRRRRMVAVFQPPRPGAAPASGPAVGLVSRPRVVPVSRARRRPGIKSGADRGSVSAQAAGPGRAGS